MNVFTFIDGVNLCLLSIMSK